MVRGALQLAALGTMLVAAQARAQPVTRPAQATCTVRILQAPDAVRAEIERWVRAEPRCERELDVRVTAVRGGLRLVATGTDGRVRERVIPDAQSAAVLVVSWMADDSIDDALDAAVAPPADLPAAGSALSPPALTPPLLRPQVDSESPFGPSLRETVPPRLLRHRWLAIGAAFSDDALGLHVQADVLGTGSWSLGLAGGWREQGPDQDEPMRRAAGGGDSALIVAYTHSLGPVDLRAQVGLGADLTLHSDRMGTTETGVEPAAYAAALLRLHLGGQWGVVGGPLVDAPLDGHGARVSAFAGVEHRL